MKGTQFLFVLAPLGLLSGCAASSVNQNYGKAYEQMVREQTFDVSTRNTGQGDRALTGTDPDAANLALTKHAQGLRKPWGRSVLRRLVVAVGRQQRCWQLGKYGRLWQQRRRKLVMRGRSKQRGITLVVIAIAILAVVAMAGLAIDIGRLVGDKSRLQATVDVTALSAAKVLDTTGSAAAATAAANSTFTTNIALQTELAGSAGTMAVQFSNTLTPFVPGTLPPLYAQVTATGYAIPSTPVGGGRIHLFRSERQRNGGPQSDAEQCLQPGADGGLRYPWGSGVRLYGRSDHGLAALDRYAGNAWGWLLPAAIVRRGTRSGLRRRLRSMQHGGK